MAEEGGPATVLLEQAAGAELLVVGSRRLGTAKRLLLGSVGRDLVRTHRTSTSSLDIGNESELRQLVPQRRRVGEQDCVEPEGGRCVDVRG